MANTARVHKNIAWLSDHGFRGWTPFNEKKKASNLVISSKMSQSVGSCWRLFWWLLLSLPGPDRLKRIELGWKRTLLSFLVKIRWQQIKFNVRSCIENMSHLFANYCSLSVWCYCLFEARQCLSVEQLKGSWKHRKEKQASSFCTAQKKKQSSFGVVEICQSTLVAMVLQTKGCTKHFI